MKYATGIGLTFSAKAGLETFKLTSRDNDGNRVTRVPANSDELLGGRQRPVL